MSDDDNRKTYSITELCRTYDVTPRALRFYESQDLLRPERDGLRRIYSHRDRARLALILRGKRFGFSLQEIRELLDLYDEADGPARQLAATYERAQARLVAMRAQRDELTEAIAELETQIRAVEQVLATNPHLTSRPPETAAPAPATRASADPRANSPMHQPSVPRAEL